MNKYFVSFTCYDHLQGAIFGNFIATTVEYSAVTEPEKFLREIREKLAQDGNPGAVVLYWKQVF